MQPLAEYFRKFAQKAANAFGSDYAFLIAIVITVAWLVTGPMFGFSDAWQLVINTFTNIATFLIVFLIQNTQNRDSRAIQIKLDEVLRSITEARNRLIDVEDMSEDDIKRLEEEFKRIRERSHKDERKE